MFDLFIFLLSFHSLSQLILYYNKHFNSLLSIYFNKQKIQVPQYFSVSFQYAYIYDFLHNILGLLGELQVLKIKKSYDIFIKIIIAFTIIQVMTEIKHQTHQVKQKSQKISKSDFLRLLAENVASNKATIQHLDKTSKKQSIYSQKNVSIYRQNQEIQKFDSRRQGSYDTRNGKNYFRSAMEHLDLYQSLLDDDTFSSYSSKSSKKPKDPFEVSPVSESKFSEQIQSLSQSQIRSRNSIYNNFCLSQFEDTEESCQKIQRSNKTIPATFTKKNPFSETVSTIQTISRKNSQQNLIMKPARIQDFKLGKRIGSGKFGQVYASQHIKTGMVVAIKQIKKSQMDEKSLVQLIREVKIQSYLDHSNIAKLYTFFDKGDYIYLVMEYCTSGDMYTYLKKNKRLQQKQVKNIIRQICNAVQYLHQNNIIHRDLKPQNLLLQHKVVKICDFGWAVSSKVNRQTFCGTPIYVSPELLKRSQYDSKIDVWSIGILTYELLYGKVPFEIYTQGDLVKIIEDDIYFSQRIVISDIAKNFILNCLQKDPRQRMNVFELLLDDFLKKEKQSNQQITK